MTNRREVSPAQRLNAHDLGQGPQTREFVQGGIIGMELEREKGMWGYEVKVIAPDSRLIEMNVDAHSGNIVSKSVRRKGSRDRK